MIFNLIDDPWIPVITTSGKSRDFSIKETFTQANRLTGLTGSSPLETAAIYRLLLAIIHSALRGPRDIGEWHQYWKKDTWDIPELHDYLDQWHHRFNLFDPKRPFYQMPDERAKPKSINNIVFDMVSGNNAVLFDHHTDLTGAGLTFAQAARVIVTVQTFGLAGLAVPQLKLTYTDAPWSRGVIFLIEGKTLFETLGLNLLEYDPDNDRPIPINGIDRPAWESDDPYFPERTIPTGYLDYLTWHNRRVFLIPDDASPGLVKQATVLPGLRLSDITLKDAKYLDPMKHYRQDQTRGLYLPLRFNEERALWRDSSALLNIHSQNHPPQTFHEIAILSGSGYLPMSQSLQFIALGMANDQAKIEFFREERLPLPIVFLGNDRLVGLLADAVTRAENMNRNFLYAAGWLALLTIDPGADGKKWNEINKPSREQARQLIAHWGVERAYWGTLEAPFYHLLNELPDHSDQALAEWITILEKAAWKALEDAIGYAGDDVTALKASVRARSIFGYSLRQQDQ